MRLLLFIIVSFTFFIWSGQAEVRAQTLDPNADCLAVVGTFTNKKKIDSVQVYLFKNNDVVDSIKVSSKKGFAFILKPNCNYSILETKRGYYSRLVSISTFLPPGVVPKPVFIFGFKIELLKQKKTVDDFWLDFPIAQVAYDPASQMFDYDKKYTQTIKDELVKLGFIPSRKR
jgi:hypothetical protein